MKRKTNKDGYSLKMAFLFLALVVCLLVISASFKIISVAAKSTFDGRHRFTIGVHKEKTLFYTMSFSPESQSISFLNIPEKQFEINRNELKENEAMLRKNLAVPIDGFVQYTISGKEKKGLEKDKVDNAIFDLILNYRNIKTRLTIIDLFRLWMYARSIPPRSILTKDFPKTSDDFLIDKVSADLFNDYSLSQEKSSIQIINGTDISGLGSKIARVLTNAGANIVAVSTSENNIETSELLYFDKKNYSIDRISKILGINLLKESEREGVADITIKLGKDLANY